MNNIYFWILMAIVFKSITIGSDFNFGAWLIHGKKYSKWYNSRETWSQHKNKEVL